MFIFQLNTVSTRSRGMSNLVVLAIGLVIGLVAAGAFIMLQQNQKKATEVAPATSQTADVSTTEPAKTVAPQPAVEQTAATPPKVSTPVTQNDVQQVQIVKKKLDNALLAQRKKVDDAIKAANAVSAGKAVMALDELTLKSLSEKVGVIIEEEKKFTIAITNVEKALVQLINQTTLAGDNKLKAARGYMYQLSPQTALNVRKANLVRWTSFKQFVDFLANNFGKWEFDAQKKNTKLIDQTLGDELKKVVGNVNVSTAAVKKAEGEHIQIVKRRLAQIQKVQQAAKAKAAAAQSAVTPTAPVQPAK